MTQAWALFNKGAFQEARELAAQVVRWEPTNSQARLLIGVSFVKQADYPAAIEALGELVRLDPMQFDAWNWLSLAQSRVGDFAEAESMARRARKLKPASADALSNLGVALFGLERFDEAATVFTEATRLEPTGDFHFINLGRALERSGKPMLAFSAFGSAASLARDPRNALKHQMRIMEGLEKWTEARAMARSYVKQYPQEATGHSTLGLAEIRLGRVEGLDSLRKAVELGNDPKDLLQLAYSLQGRGEFGEAEELLLRAISLDAGLISTVLSALATNGSDLSKFPEIIENGRRALQDGALGEHAAAQIHFALGAAMKGQGDYEAALSHYDEGNALLYRSHCSERPFQTAAYESTLNRLIDNSMRLKSSLPSGFGFNGESPVFVVGMMRSGTTLMHQILTTDPTFVGVGELGFIESSGAVQELPLEATEVWLRSQVRKYLERVDRIRRREGRFVDKLPGNYLYLGFIALAFPKAKVIHMVRDPIDTCLSIWMTPNAVHPSWSHDRENIAFVYRAYRKLMEQWKALLPEGTILDVSYEELLNNPEAVTREIAAFLGIAWTPSFLNHAENASSVATPSLWQVRQPLYTSSIGKAKTYEPWLGAFGQLR